MNEELVLKIDEAIAAKLAEVAALQAARKALKGGPAPTPQPQPQKPPQPAKTRSKASTKAPPGFLEETMAKAITAKPGMTSAEIRAKLASERYPYSMEALHITKRLTKGVEANRWKAKEENGKRRFYPMK